MDGCSARRVAKFMRVISSTAPASTAIASLVSPANGLTFASCRFAESTSTCGPERARWFDISSILCPTRVPFLGVHFTRMIGGGVERARTPCSRWLAKATARGR